MNTHANKLDASMFTYPLTFKDVTEHVKHIVLFKDFYTKVLDRCDTVASHELEIKKKENRELAAQNKKIQEEQVKLQKQFETKNVRLTKEQKELEDEKRQIQQEQQKLHRELEIKNNELIDSRLKIDEADRLLEKVKQYDNVPSVAKGKKFEELIRYALEQERKKFSCDCFIEKTDRTHACDIRIHVAQIGVVAIEAKDKNTILKTDIEKFNRDRVENHFTGSIFWSRRSKIPACNDTGEGEEFIQFFENNQTLYVRGEDFRAISQMIFVYIRFLIILKQDKEKDDDIEKLVGRMFEMILVHYNAFGNLKKEMQKVDKLMVKDITIIDELCRKHKVPHKKFVVEDSSLFIARKSEIRNWHGTYRNSDIVKNQSYFGSSGFRHITSKSLPSGKRNADVLDKLDRKRKIVNVGVESTLEKFKTIETNAPSHSKRKSIDFPRIIFNDNSNEDENEVINDDESQIY